MRSKVRSPSATPALALLVSWFISPYACGDQIVLRNLDVISDRTVKTLDEDGVLLDDGERITWDDIAEGTVEASKQAEFDKMLKELGGPLYRIQQRLKTGDYEGLLEHAEAVYPRYENRQSPTAYMVFQSLMWARLASGQREQAVEPYLRAYEYLRATRTTKPDLPGSRRLDFDPATALTPTLQPVWFDADSAKASLEGVRKAARAMKAPHPDGVFLYYSTLALTAGESESALTTLDRVQGRQRAAKELKQIVLAQQEVLAGKLGSDVSRLESTVDTMLPQNQAVACYWLGLARTGREEKEARLRGVLRLLRIPALFGKQSPELAAAGLYHAMTTLSELKDIKGSLAVRRELQVRYAHTTHAAKLNAPRNPSKQN